MYADNLVPLPVSQPYQASKVSHQRAKINARIARRFNALHDRKLGRLRGVDGFEAQVEVIERSIPSASSCSILADMVSGDITNAIRR